MRWKKKKIQMKLYLKFRLFVSQWLVLTSAICEAQNRSTTLFFMQARDRRNLVMEGSELPTQCRWCKRPIGSFLCGIYCASWQQTKGEHDPTTLSSICSSSRGGHFDIRKQILAKRTFAPLRKYTHLGQMGLEPAWRCTNIMRLCAIHKFVPIGGHYYYSG